jgi:hypothetical protein
MKINFYTILIISLVCVSIIRAETPSELAVKIINGQPRSGYNPRDNSSEELAAAYAFNSKMSLNWHMVNDKGISEQLRISYAIHLLDDALGIQKVLKSGTKTLSKEEEIMRQRLILGGRLAELAKAEQAVGGNRR